MPFKSEAQRRKFASMVKDGKMSQETFDQWEKETKGKLPERVGQQTQKQVRSVDDIRNEYKRRFGK